MGTRWLRGLDKAAPVVVRLALAAGFFSAVADRLGAWGMPGAPHVAWGSFAAFLSYTARLNPFVPATLIPAVGWMATVLEVACGALLVLGLGRPWVALGSSVLLLTFGIGMALDGGPKPPLDASVFAAASAALLLAAHEHREGDKAARLEAGARAGGRSIG